MVCVLASRRQFAESPELLTTLGLLYMRAGQHQKAFEQLGSALAHQNDSTGAILAAGSMMQVRPRFNAARFNAARYPSSAPVAIYRASMYSHFE